MANTYTSLHYHLIFNDVAHQREHHRTRTVQEEYRAFLEKHGIEYDERYVWG